MPRADRPPTSPGRLPGRPVQDRTPGAGQDALAGLGDPTPFQGPRGQMVRDVASSIEEAKRTGRLGLIEGAMCGLALGQARAYDIAASRQDPYAMTQAGRALLSILDRLGLAPAPAAQAPAGGGELEAFLAGLSGPTVGDPEVA